MSINLKQGMTITVNLSVEPTELDEDCSKSLILKEDMSDLQKKVIDCIEEVGNEANQRLRAKLHHYDAFLKGV